MFRAWTSVAMVSIVIAIFAGCGDPIKPEDLVVSIDKSFSLNVGETAIVEGENLEITLVSLVHDNRCPANADCIWPGMAQIELCVKRGGSQTESLKLDLLAGADSMTLDLFSTTLFGYSFRFEQFEPYPGLALIAETPPEPPARRAQLRISRSSIHPPTDGYVSITDIDPVLLKVDPFELDSAWSSGDTLLLNVTVTGGCEQHYFFLYMSPAAFLESHPPQANIYLRHVGNYDSCKAIVPMTLRFDISEIRRLYEQTYGRFAAIQLNLFRYFDNAPGESVPVRYGPDLIPVGIGRYWIYEVCDPRFSSAPDVTYIDTISIVGSELANGKTWWSLGGKHPSAVFGLGAFSYRADTVIGHISCNGEKLETRHFVPMLSGSFEYYESDCTPYRRRYADQDGDTTLYQSCRNCPDNESTWRVVPGIGVITGGKSMFLGDSHFRLLEYGDNIGSLMAR